MPDVLREALKQERLKPCRHISVGSAHQIEATRPDLTAWQEAQSEWFNPTILEIVGEYATWRDRAVLEQSKWLTLNK